MRPDLRRLVAIVVVALSLVACATATEPELALAVGLDAREFARDSAGDVQILFRVSNSGNSSVYLVTCGASVTADVERRSGPADWALAVPSFFCVSSLAVGPRRLDPGQTVTGVQSTRLPAGEYRLRVLVSLDPQGQPTRSTTSDVISIR